MDSVWLPDLCCLAFSYCNKTKDEGTPNCCSKLCLPMTTVYQNEGKCTTGVGLAAIFGPFYTFFCWEPEVPEVTKSKGDPSPTGYSKLRY